MTHPLRIAVVGACPYPVPQGSQVYLRETALALRRAGHAPRLMVYSYGVGKDESGLPIDRCGAIPFARKTKAGPSLAKPFLDAALAHTLRRVCRKHDIDAVSAHNYEGLLVALAARCRPIVYHAHNAMRDELPTYFNGAVWARRFGAWLDKTLPRRADACVVPHERLRQYLVECGCNPDKVHVVPPSIDPIYDAMPTISDAIPPILYTGNLDAYQNLPLLADAMDLLHNDFPGLQLKVVSGDSLTNTPLNGRRWVEHIASANRAALKSALSQDCIVVCTRVSWSGYPMKLLNAMCAGQAIVCCASSAHPLTHEFDALTVPDNDPQAFAAAIAQLIANPALRTKLGNAARESWLRNHSPESFSRALGNLYTRLASDDDASIPA